MSNTRSLALIFCSLLIVGCTATGPADDGYENSNELTDNGRLLSDEAKTIYSTEEAQSSTEEAQNATTPAPPASTITMDDKTEFEQFKVWNKLKTTGVDSEEYQEFQQWLRYQEFKSTQ